MAGIPAMTLPMTGIPVSNDHLNWEMRAAALESWAAWGKAFQEAQKMTCAYPAFREPPGLERFTGKPSMKLELSSLLSSDEDGSVSSANPSPRLSRKAAQRSISSISTSSASARSSPFPSPTSRDKPQILGKISDSLATPLGAFACQANGSATLLELLPKEPELILQLKGYMPKMVLDKHGCWVAQLALEVANFELQLQLVSELRGRISSCSQHMQGNFVLQKMVEVLKPSALNFVIEELEDKIMDVATHVYGCRVVQRLFEHCCHETQLCSLLAAMLDCPMKLRKLISNAHGCNVIRALLTRGRTDPVKKVVDAMLEEGKVINFAKNRHSSLVLEKCLEVCEGESRDRLWQAFIGEDGTSPPFMQIMLDRFGNYIAQRLINISKSEAEMQRLQELLQAAGPKLGKSPNGKHIIAAAEKKFGNCPMKMAGRNGKN
mmetsp:Transcript_102841/g.182704  ORF Transcript_102841/g.182704 Transcript_102841/m.182704 type:complete len:435 (+) Transcript_102841:85-1389(+)